MSITNNLRGVDPFLPSWFGVCGTNPSLNAILDAIDDNAQPVSIDVISTTNTAPPVSPTSGDVYIVATGGTGDWLGQDGNVATYNGASWDFTSPVLNQMAYVQEQNTFYKYTGSWDLLGPLPERSFVIDKDLTAPPVSPTSGDTYIVASGATGDWLNKDGNIARWNGTAWTFHQPIEPHSVYINDERIIYEYNGSTWVAKSSPVILEDGSTAFTNPQPGVDPTLPAHLTTKNYVDTEVTDTVSYVDTEITNTINYVDTEIAGISALSANGWANIAETLSYTSANDPEFTATFTGQDLTGVLSAGMKLEMVNVTVKYFVVTKVVLSGADTILTLYGGTDYNLTNNPITSLKYSTSKAPQGFPLDMTKWTEIIIDTGDHIIVPTTGVWYNLNFISLTVPTGAWEVGYRCYLGTETTTAGAKYYKATLSTANNSETIQAYTTGGFAQRGLTQHFLTLSIDVNIETTVSTTYYLNEISLKGANILRLGSGNMNTIVYARSIYI